MLTLVIYTLIFGIASAENYEILQIIVPSVMYNDIVLALEAIAPVEVIQRTNLPDDHSHTESEFDMDYYYDDAAKISEPSLPMPRARPKEIEELRFLTAGKLSTSRRARETLDSSRWNSPNHAGYTADVNTCTIYNRNLDKVWSTLSKHLNIDSKNIDKGTLHNIALMIKAYLDHTEHNNSTRNGTVENESVVIDILAKVKNILTETIIDEDTPKIILDLIIITATALQPIEISECMNETKTVLASFIHKAFQNYLNDYLCHIDVRNNMPAIKKEKRDTIDKTNVNGNNISRRQETDPKILSCEEHALEAFLHSTRLLVHRYLTSPCDPLKLLWMWSKN